MVEVQLCTPGGECLARATLPLSSRAADMRKALSTIEMKGESIFLIGTRVVEEEVTLQGAGAVAASTVVVTVLFDMRPCFEWADFDVAGGSLENSHTYKRGMLASTTHGVRTSSPLPRDTWCYIQMRRIGTHSTVGLGTSACPLSSSTYRYLYGQDAQSWALAFGRAIDHFEAFHGGLRYELQDTSGQVVTPPGPEEDNAEIGFLVTKSGKMHFQLPGHEAEFLAPFKIPENLDVYAVASTVYGGGEICISQSPFEPRTNLSRTNQPDP